MIKLQNEEQLLNLEFRKLVIQDILGPENLQRKAESLKRYEIYKDQVKKFVVEGLKNEGLKSETVAQMANRCSNISICRKIVNKLARAYSGGVKRDTGNAGNNEQLDALARLLAFDEKMKKGDRYRELQKNMLFQVVPELAPSDDSGLDRYKIAMRALLPWHYDVIEDARDREVPRVVILSDFYGGEVFASVSSDQAKTHGAPRNLYSVRSDGVDSVIADAPQDARSKAAFVWWSDKYHFQTDGEGNIIPIPENEGNENPINTLPFVNNADDQDGQFWAVGGDDLIDGSVLINKKITDMNYISYLQGYGQYVITGRNVNGGIEMGPNNAIIIDYDPNKGDPEPKVNIISANPPLDSWLRVIEQYTALLLTTNNLSPGNVSMRLDANNFASGIALIIEKSEATDDISDKQKSYKVIERVLWKIISRWQNLYFGSGELTQEFAEIGVLPEDLDVNVQFNEVAPAITEGEKLDSLKKRKELGINTEVEILQMDNPDLTEAEAEKKLLKIKEEKMANLSMAMDNAAAMADPTKPAKDDAEGADDAEEGDDDESEVQKKAANS